MVQLRDDNSNDTNCTKTKENNQKEGAVKVF